MDTPLRHLPMEHLRQRITLRGPFQLGLPTVFLGGLYPIATLLASFNGFRRPIGHGHGFIKSSQTCEPKKIDPAPPPTIESSVDDEKQKKTKSEIRFNKRRAAEGESLFAHRASRRRRRRRPIAASFHGDKATDGRARYLISVFFCFVLFFLSTAAALLCGRQLASLPPATGARFPAKTTTKTGSGNKNRGKPNKTQEKPSKTQ